MSLTDLTNAGLRTDSRIVFGKYVEAVDVPRAGVMHVEQAIIEMQLRDDAAQTPVRRRNKERNSASSKG